MPRACRWHLDYDHFEGWNPNSPWKKPMNGFFHGQLAERLFCGFYRVGFVKPSAFGNRKHHAAKIFF